VPRCAATRSRASRLLDAEPPDVLAHRRAPVAAKLAREVHREVVQASAAPALCAGERPHAAGREEAIDFLHGGTEKPTRCVGEALGCAQVRRCGPAVRGDRLCARAALPDQRWRLDEASVAAILFVGLAFLITLALGLLGSFLGGAVARRRRLWFAALGVFHAAIQLGALLLMTRFAAVPALIWIALIWTGLGVAGWALYKRGLGAAVAVCISLTYPSHAAVPGNSSKLPVVRLCE
jgi:hypothetical protein